MLTLGDFNYFALARQGESFGQPWNSATVVDDVEVVDWCPGESLHVRLKSDARASQAIIILPRNTVLVAREVEL